MACKEICSRYRAKRIRSGRYADGQARCQVCDIFIRWDGLRCPCCGNRLRHKPRNKLFRDRLRENGNTAIPNV